MKQVVIVGAGHAAAQLCGSLVESGLACRITLVGDEAGVPYHRPPLSKLYLKTIDAAPMPIRAEAYYQQHGITLNLGDAATAIDRQARTVTLQSGRTLPYDELVLATGARARRLPGVAPGTTGIHYLRNTEDAAKLRDALHAAKTLLVIGGGFIGLEIAATANALGKHVTVLESAPRLLPRTASPEISAYLLEQHRQAGIEIHLNARVETIAIDNGSAVGAHYSIAPASEQHVLMADLIVAGIGAQPETTLAQQAGLECDDGIIVDAHMRSSDPHILAVGDCTRFPLYGDTRRIRLEAVQNAGDQARCAAATLAEQPLPYSALPWFWSEQGSMRIQIAGLLSADTQRYLRGETAGGKFSVLHYANDKLVAVESINLAADHLAARKLIETGVALDAGLACDASIPLKNHIPAL